MRTILRRRSSTAVFRDWSIYLAVGAAVGLGAILLAHANVDSNASMGWITAVATAAFVFRFLCEELLALDCGNPTLIAIVGIPELFVSYMALIIVLGPPPKPPQ